MDNFVFLAASAVQDLQPAAGGILLDAGMGLLCILIGACVAAAAGLLFLREAFRRQMKVCTLDRRAQLYGEIVLALKGHAPVHLADESVCLPELEQNIADNEAQMDRLKAEKPPGAPDTLEELYAKTNAMKQSANQCKHMLRQYEATLPALVEFAEGKLTELTFYASGAVRSEFERYVSAYKGAYSAENGRFSGGQRVAESKQELVRRMRADLGIED